MKILGFILVVMISVGGMTDSIKAEENKGEVVFERNDKVLTWQTNNYGDFKFTDDIGLKINSNLATSLNMTTGKGVNDRWYDTVTNSAELNYRFSDKTDMAFTAHEEWNKDTMSKLGNSLFTTDYRGRINYKPLRSITLNADFGHIFDRRFENSDNGTEIRGRIDYIGKPLENMSLNLNSSGETSNLKRTKDGYEGAGTISYKHSDMDLSLRFNDVFNRRGYFSDIDRSTIEKRERHDQTLGLILSRGNFTQLSKKTAIELSIDLENKVITDSANNNPQSSKYQNNANGGTKGFNLRTGKVLGDRVTTEWALEYAKNDNGVERLSRRRTQTDVATKGLCLFGLGFSDTVKVEGWVKRTRIDTPVGVANDRDELKIEGGVLYSRHFSEIFETALDFRVLETHYVNIDVSQSSQNKWMKTYLFSPTLVYSPLKSVKIHHAVNVYANYITYDFDNDYSPRSNISRRVSSESWIDIIFSQKTLVKAGIMFEDNDYGRLTTEGSKLPAEEGIKRFGDILIEYRFTDWLTLSPHYIYAVRRDWSISEDMTVPIRSEVDQTYGLNCYLFRRENGSINLSMKRIIRNTRKYPVRIRDYITMSLQYGF